MDQKVEIYSDKKMIGIKHENDSHKEMMDEFFKTGRVSTKHKHSKCLILTKNGKLILQKRSKWSGDNSGLWDKTVGGHTINDESFEFTIVRECAEELQIPTTIVNRKDIKHALELIDLKIMGVLFLLEINKNDTSVRKLKNGKSWKEQGITAYYFGYYDGSIKFKTGECSGFRISTLEEIEEEMKSNPESFTKDMYYILNKFRHLIKPIDVLK